MVNINNSSKLYSIYLVAVVAFFALWLFLPQQAVASEGMKLSIGETRGDAGTQVEVPIMASQAAGSEGGQFLLKFNPELVKPLNIEPGDLLETANDSMQMANLDYDYGLLSFMWITVYGDTADSGTVCTITFELLKDGSTNLELTDIIVSPAGFPVAAPGQGRMTVGDQEVGQDEGENDEEQNDLDENGDQAEEDEPLDDELDPEEEAEEDETESEEDTVFNYLLFVGLPLILLAGVAIIVIKKRVKKAEKPGAEK